MSGRCARTRPPGRHTRRALAGRPTQQAMATGERERRRATHPDSRTPRARRTRRRARERHPTARPAPATSPSPPPIIFRATDFLNASLLLHPPHPHARPLPPCRRPASGPPASCLGCPARSICRSRKGGPARSGGPPFLESPGLVGDLGPEAGRRHGALKHHQKRPPRETTSGSSRYAWEAPGQTGSPDTCAGHALRLDRSRTDAIHLWSARLRRHGDRPASLAPFGFTWFGVRRIAGRAQRVTHRGRRRCRRRTSMTGLPGRARFGRTPRRSGRPRERQFLAIGPATCGAPVGGPLVGCLADPRAP